jgi:hypothetical protein
VVRRGAASLRVDRIVGPGRLLPPDARRLGLAEELEQLDAANVAFSSEAAFAEASAAE